MSEFYLVTHKTGKRRLITRAFKVHREADLINFSVENEFPITFMKQIARHVYDDTDVLSRVNLIPFDGE